MLAALPLSAQEKVSARTASHADAKADTSATNQVSQVEIPKSVFSDTPQRKDPFFPNASYRTYEEKVVVIDNHNVGNLEKLKLTGFGGIANRRWAMINGVSIYETETAKVRVDGMLMEVVCLEIRDRSVVVGNKNSSARREIHLD